MKLQLVSGIVFGVVATLIAVVRRFLNGGSYLDAHYVLTNIVSGMSLPASIVLMFAAIDPVLLKLFSDLAAANLAAGGLIGVWLTIYSIAR